MLSGLMSMPPWYCIPIIIYLMSSGLTIWKDWASCCSGIRGWFTNLVLLDLFSLLSQSLDVFTQLLLLLEQFLLFLLQSPLLDDILMQLFLLFPQNLHKKHFYLQPTLLFPSLLLPHLPMLNLQILIDGRWGEGELVVVLHVATILQMPLSKTLKYQCKI